MINNSSVFVKWQALIHFAAGKMAGRTVFYKDGFDLFLKIDPANCLARNFRRRKRKASGILKVARLDQQYRREYDEPCFHLQEVNVTGELVR